MPGTTCPTCGGPATKEEGKVNIGGGKTRPIVITRCDNPDSCKPPATE